MSPALKKKRSPKEKVGSGGVTGNTWHAYNPIVMEVAKDASRLPVENIDDLDGTASEYDSVSTNGSSGGDSEDPKDRQTNSGVSDSKRDKIRLKNEKKHQRQREKRAQELHDRCNAYLMSRKLESLSRQLVAMGFSHERATLALMFNEGKVEQSINWLFEVSEEEASRNKNKNTELGSGGNLKIDIRDDLSRISELEGRYKCSRQEVERVVVSCEGDLSRVEEILQAQKQETPAAPPMQGGSSGDAQNLKMQQERPKVAASIPVRQTRNEGVFNYTKLANRGPAYSEPPQSKLIATNNRWPMTASDRSPLIQAKLMHEHVDIRQVVGNEGRDTRSSMRQPLLVMQDSESTNGLQSHVPNMRATHLRENLLQDQSIGRSFGHMNHLSEQTLHATPLGEVQETPFVSGNLTVSTSSRLGSSGNLGTRFSPYSVPYEPLRSNSMSRPALPSLTAPSSLGLFTNWGSIGPESSSSHVDWNKRGLMPELDYTNIDWSLNSDALSSKSSGFRPRIPPLSRRNDSSGINITNGFCNYGWGDGLAKGAPKSAGGQEWTSPFAGHDIFSLHRHLVGHPSKCE